jgi:hypothetical protein
MKRIAASSLAFAAMTFGWAEHASALEVNAGDYEAFDPGSNILVVYAQHAGRKKLYADGRKISSNADLRSDVGILRFVHVEKLADDVVIDPQFLLPFGKLDSGGDISALGSTSGVGDLILAAPIKWVINKTTRDTLSLGPFLHLPTGSYDEDRALNLGENRWRLVTQLAYVGHFGSRWALDLIGDVTVFGDNDKFSSSRSTLKQKPRYEVQSHIRYNLNPSTALMLTYGIVKGGETRIDGVSQDDRLDTSYGRIGVAHFFNPTTQLIAQYGKDISIDSGLKEDNRVNLRLVKVF